MTHRGSAEVRDKGRVAPPVFETLNGSANPQLRISEGRVAPSKPSQTNQGSARSAAKRSPGAFPSSCLTLRGWIAVRREARRNEWLCRPLKLTKANLGGWIAGLPRTRWPERRAPSLGLILAKLRACGLFERTVACLSFLAGFTRAKPGPLPPFG